MFKVLGGDGKEYGPISADTVRQWIAESRISATSKIQAEGSTEWKTIAEFAEFQNALASGGGGQRRSSPPPAPVAAAPAQTSGLAIASLVFGLLGCFFLPALAGLICGIVAMVKINKSRGQLGGNGLAIAGVCISGFMLLFSIPFLAGMMLPALSRAKDTAQRINCVSHLKLIGSALGIYSGNNNDRFPSSLLDMTNELGTPIVLVCPSDRSRISSESWLGFTTSNISYEFLTPGVYESNVVSTVVVRCPIHGHTCLGDGSVQTVNMTIRTVTPPRPNR